MTTRFLDSFTCVEQPTVKFSGVQKRIEKVKSFFRGEPRRMELQFKDAFWGVNFISNAGYEAIIQRLNDGRRTCKDMEELLKMRASAEEKYGKELVAISHKVGGFYEICTLRTSIDEMKTQTEMIGNLHIQLSGLLREEAKSIEQFREKQKEERKKSERQYEQRCREADEAEQTADRMSNASTATPKHIEKLSNKSKQCRQAAEEAERQYKSNIEQLDKIRQEWELTHINTCEMFQQQEAERLKALRNGLWVHCNHLSMQCVKADECYESVRQILEKCDVIANMNCFVGIKGTGSSRPAPIEYQNYYERDATEVRNGSMGLVGGVMKKFSNLLQGNSLAGSSMSLHKDPSADSTGDYEDVYSAIPRIHGSQQSEEYKAVYEYVAQRDDELSMSAGDAVLVTDQGEDGWWMVQRDGQMGLVPGSYLAKE
ncbi:proline-serine-threonine phosphatase-interacting protein 1a isoform X2 [Vanacampus margaritifer]